MKLQEKGSKDRGEKSRDRSKDDRHKEKDDKHRYRFTSAVYENKKIWTVRTVIKLLKHRYKTHSLKFLTPLNESNIDREFALWVGDPSFILRLRHIKRIVKMVLDAYLLSTQHIKNRSWFFFLWNLMKKLDGFLLELVVMHDTIQLRIACLTNDLK